MIYSDFSQSNEKSVSPGLAGTFRSVKSLVLVAQNKKHYTIFLKKKQLLLSFVTYPRGLQNFLALILEEKKEREKLFCALIISAS